MITRINSLNSILIVDDDDSILLSINTTLRIAGWENVITCNDSRKAMDLIHANQIDVLLLDLTMPYICGKDLLPLVKEYVDIPVIIVTGAVDVKTAVRCIQLGAYDYIVKPIEEDQLITTVKTALAFQNLKKENIAFKQYYLSDFSSILENPEVFKNIITNNKKMLLIFQYMESIASTSQPILIRGETGVGKELIAKALHRLSSLCGNFVAVNAAGLDDNVFSDTLFGHVKGAFTGADHIRQGLIEQANQGTLFLDEIGDLSLASQVKLLRLLQEGEYFPLGGDYPKKAKVRIIAATNQDLAVLQEKSHFRKDLNYRLNTHRVNIPPLRERMDDVPILFNHFLKETASALNKDIPDIPKDFFGLLKTYSFPGNIRELKAMIYDAMSRHKSGILLKEAFQHHISREQSIDNRSPAPGNSSPISFPFKLPTIKEVTNILVLESIKRTEGNQSSASRMLGISQQALSKRLKKLKKNPNNDK